MRVLQGHVSHHNPNALDVGRFKVSQQIELVACSGGHAVVANERLRKAKDLAAVGGIRHGLRIGDQGGREDALPRDTSLCAKRLAVVNGAVVNGEGGHVVQAFAMPTHMAGIVASCRVAEPGKDPEHSTMVFQMWSAMYSVEIREFVAMRMR